MYGYPTKKKYLQLSLWFFSFYIFFSVASALDVSSTMPYNESTWFGSFGSRISFSTGSVEGTTYYSNKDNDSATIGNYLTWLYYDSQFGFFKLDWSSDPENNVHFNASTSKCSDGYGYQLTGYAYGSGAWLIDFSYNSDIFVYYCESDKKLHGYAYYPDVGFQSFEWIWFEISGQSNIVNALNSPNDPFFVNNSSMILSEIPEELGSVQGERSSTDWGKEAIFYIIK